VRGLRPFAVLIVALFPALSHAATSQSRVSLRSPPNSSAGDYNPTLTTDGLTLVFASTRSGGHGSGDFWQSTRVSLNTSFGTPFNLGAKINSSANESSPTISGDGLTLYFASNRSGGEGDLDLYRASRTNILSGFGVPVSLGSAVNSTSQDAAPSITNDGLSLYFTSQRSGGLGSNDIWLSTRPSLRKLFGAPVNLGPGINTSDSDFHPHISDDGLTLYLASRRPGAVGGGAGNSDIYVATRSSSFDTFGAPENPGPAVNTAGFEAGPHPGPDGLYFHGPGSDIWFATYSAGQSLEPLINIEQCNRESRRHLGSNRRLCPRLLYGRGSRWTLGRFHRLSHRP
jgi:hypothetical protein